MAMSTTMTTSAAQSSTIVLNPVSKSTTLVLTSSGTFAAGSSNSTIQIEASAGDPSLFGGPSLTWATISSATAMPASAVQNIPLTYEILGNYGAVRLNSTTASTGAAMSFTLQALQSVTA